MGMCGDFEICAACRCTKLRDENCRACELDAAKPDLVNRPAHYVEGRTIEPIDVIQDWKLDYCTGQVIKYLSRAGRKEGSSIIEDLRKAEFYLKRLIAEAEK